MATTDLSEAVGTVEDGSQVYVGGFGFAQPFSAAHELIRQGASDLHVVRSSGDILLDQLIGAGCVTATTISHCWNAVGPTPTHAYRRAAENGTPHEITIEEHGLGNLVLRLFAGARRLPFVPAGPVEGTGQFEHRVDPEKFSSVSVDGERHYVMPPLRPDVSVLHARRADERGNVQLTGARAEVKYGAMAADLVIVTVESTVDTPTLREAPEHTILPSFMVDQVVESPGAAHPTGIHGEYPRDVDYLAYYGEQTESQTGFNTFLEEWVSGVANRREYLERLREDSFQEVVL